MKYTLIESASKKVKIRRKDVEPFVKYITKIIGSKCNKFEVVGSYRREKSWLGDLEILVNGLTTDKIYDILSKSKKVDIVEKLWQGQIKMGLIIKSKDFKIKKLQFEVYVAKPAYWGASLLSRTGPKGLNIVMRHKAVNKGFSKLSEYGLFDKSDKRIAGKTELSIFKKLGMDYLEPKERNQYS